MDVEQLRLATAAHHQAVESAIPLMDPGLTVASYGAVLSRMYGVVAAWEDLSIYHAPALLQPIVRRRCRRALLAADLRSLAHPLPHEQPELPGYRSEASFLGAMYVMEGSRLGGTYIARHVEQTLGFTEGLGYAYFRGDGPSTGSLWKEFLDVLRTRIPEEHAEEAILAAQAMFLLFGAWMRGVPLLADRDGPHQLAG